ANLPVDDSTRNYATPIPQLNTAVNAAFNEYLIYKHETNSPRFFDLDFQKYLATNAVEVKEVSDPRLRAEMNALLKQHGYHGEQVSNQGLLKRARAAVGNLKTPMGLQGEVSVKFSALDDAIDYARTSSRMTPQSPDAVRELLQARELST
ncbi:MAG TPA: hypothetical protein VHH35_07620, partial [Pyrinomonadaceae bacterium]|nr:hypothetical protein [Pyrinomonadaceae bacterium]